jgi:PTS system N-acetylglucosamine-specific IIC component
VLNNLAWFIVGEYGGATGDLNRFFAGDPTAGVFMSGFFPVMMFGLPGACLAMYHAAPAGRRRAAGGLLLSMALTSFLTGVTEPIEFSFMFLAPALYALHAVLTGLAMALMDLLGIKLGFGFSAGFLDYALNFTKATRPLLLLPIGIGYFALYYGAFRFAIVRFDLKTPGREAEPVGEESAGDPSDRGAAFVAALGGAGNLASIDACTTRLRLVVRDQARVDDARLKALGAAGLIRPSAQGLQVVLGPIADSVAMEMRAVAGPLSAASMEDAEPVSSVATIDTAPWLAALGGRDNLIESGAASSRVWLKLRDAARIDEAALVRLGVRMIARPDGSVAHLIVADAAPIAAALQAA